MLQGLSTTGEFPLVFEGMKVDSDLHEIADVAVLREAPVSFSSIFTLIFAK